MAKAKQSGLLETLIEQINRKNTSPEVLRGAWHLATRHKDIDSMAVIAAADSLPEDVLAAVKSRNEIPVAVSYLTRGGLDLDERRARFRAEERAGVLAGCLESPALTDDDREIIGAKLVAKPTRALAEAVVNEGNMPANAVVVAIAQLDPRNDSLTEEGRRNLRKQVVRLAEDAEFAGAVAAVINHKEIARIFLSKQPNITEEQFNDLFARTIEQEMKAYADPHHKSRYAYRVVSLLRGIIGDDHNYMNAPMLAALRRHFDSEAVAKIWTEVAGATKAAAETADTSGYSQKIIDAGTTTDANLLDELIVEALSSEPSLLDSLANNPTMTATQMGKIIGHLDNRTSALALRLHQGDAKFALLVYVNNFDSAVTYDKWKCFPDPEAGKLAILDEFIKRWHNEGNNSYYSTSSRMLAEILGHIEDETVQDRLPWGFVKGQIGSYNADRYAKVVTRLQSELLGSDLKKWETAEVLANDFTGSVRELFASAAIL